VTFVDVDYRRLIDDPVVTIAAVYAAAHLDPPSDPAGFVASYQSTHPRDAHGRHRYTAASFGDSTSTNCATGSRLPRAAMTAAEPLAHLVDVRERTTRWL
jgi:hypothetical protein